MVNLSLKKSIFIFILVVCISNVYANNNLKFLYCKGNKIENGSNEILLKGLHVTNAAYGYWKYPISEELESKGHCPMIPSEVLPEWALRDQDFINIKDLGANVIRYELNYEMFAESNTNRDKNLLKLKSDIKKFNDIGIYVILDHHYMPGIDTMSAQYEDLKSEKTRMKSIFESDALWNDFVNWWVFIAAEFKNNPGIAGYEPFVEPRIPIKEEGGEEIFLKKYNEICQVIRNIDPEHIIFIPQSHSIEIGDSISWDQKLFKVDDKYSNIVYTFMAYEPWDFTSDGTHYSKAEIKEVLNEYFEYRINFSKKNNVPLLINEYGVNQRQSRENTINYFNIFHEMTEKNNISTIYYSYKSEVDPWGDGYHNMGIYSEYHSYLDDLNIAGEKYQFQDNIIEVAKKNGFYDDFYKYFYNGNEISATSITNNEKLAESIREYFTR